MIIGHLAPSPTCTALCRRSGRLCTCTSQPPQCSTTLPGSPSAQPGCSCASTTAATTPSPAPSAWARLPTSNTHLQASLVVSHSLRPPACPAQLDCWCALCIMLYGCGPAQSWQLGSAGRGVDGCPVPPASCARLSRGSHRQGPAVRMLDVEVQAGREVNAPRVCKPRVGQPEALVRCRAGHGLAAHEPSRLRVHGRARCGGPSGAPLQRPALVGGGHAEPAPPPGTGQIPHLPPPGPPCLPVGVAPWVSWSQWVCLGTGPGVR